MPDHDAMLAALARGGPMTARQLAAALDLDPHDWRDVLDPIAQLSRARLATLGPPNPPARRDGPGTTLRYQLTRAGELAAGELTDDRHALMNDHDPGVPDDRDFAEEAANDPGRLF